MLKTFFHTYFLTILTQKMNASFTMYGDKLCYMFRIVFPTIYVQQLLLYYNIHTKKYVDCVTYDTLLIIVLQKEYYHVFAFTCTTLIHIFVFSSPLCTRTSNIFNKSPPHLLYVSFAIAFFSQFTPNSNQVAKQ